LSDPESGKADFKEAQRLQGMLALVDGFMQKIGVSRRSFLIVALEKID
jgi:hypothetical protein